MEAAPVQLTTDNPAERRQSSPWRDGLHLFLQNRLAVLGALIIVFFFFLALTAPLWTAVGLLDQRSGFETWRTVNPVGAQRVDPYADPLTCTREGLTSTAPWCDLLSEADRARYPQQCAVNAPPPPERQWCFVLGSDQNGRDWLTQAVYGAQISLAVGVLGATLSLIIGTVYGLISGYFGGAVDNAMMRFVDFIYGVPGLVVIILMSVFFREMQRTYDDSGGLVGVILDVNQALGGLLFLFVVIALFSWTGMARLTRGLVLSYREREFVEAARAVGASNRRIIFVHLMPNIIGPLLVAETMAVPGYIFTEAFLSFIGLGVSSDTPSWGAMISQVREGGGFTSNQYIWIVPSVALIAITLAFNFFGDGLRDAFDPRLRGLK